MLEIEGQRQPESFAATAGKVSQLETERRDAIALRDALRRDLSR